MKRLFGVFSVLIMLLSLMACAGKQPMTASKVADEVNRINMELPRRISRNMILERVSLDEVKSVLVCHYTVDTWDRADVVVQKQSKHLFCKEMEQKYRDHLFSMVDKIEYEYKTTDGRMQYAFVADKTTCN
jgi:predicted small lipoprotein YifL